MTREAKDLKLVGRRPRRSGLKFSLLTGESAGCRAEPRVVDRTVANSAAAAPCASTTAARTTEAAWSAFNRLGVREPVSTRPAR